MKPKAGHQQAVLELMHTLTKFCDDTNAGWVPAGAHSYPGSNGAIVLTVQFSSHEQKDDFLHAEEYHNFRIELLKHANAKDIYVSK